MLEEFLEEFGFRDLGGGRWERRWEKSRVDVQILGDGVRFEWRKKPQGPRYQDEWVDPAGDVLELAAFELPEFEDDAAAAVVVLTEEADAFDRGPRRPSSAALHGFDGRKSTKYPGAISVTYAGPPSQAWYVMWHDQVLRIFSTRIEAEHYATQLTTPGVEPLHPRREERKRRAKEKAAGIFDEMIDTMRQDPGFQELARKRETERKKARLQYGRQLFHPGDYVDHVDREGYPWLGTVVSAVGYRENDIDGPGHYYEVKWWDPALRQYHEDYLHQDLLKPHER